MATPEKEIGQLVSTRSSWDVTRPLIHSCYACIAVDTLIVLAKTYSRVRLAKLQFWWDDFWVIVAWALLMPICAIGIFLVNVETSWQDDDRIIVDFDVARTLLVPIYLLVQFLFASYAATRFAILALYLRIFANARLRKAIWGVIVFVTLQWLGFAIQGLLQCRPLQYFWNWRIEGGSCIHVDEFYRSVTPFNMVVDLVVIVLPLPAIWNLKANYTRKWALTLFFGIGIVALIASAIRLSVYSTHTSKYLAPSYTNLLVIWLVIEPSIYLIASCLPAMHHVVVACIPAALRRGMASRMQHRAGGKFWVSGSRDAITRDSDDGALQFRLGAVPGLRPARSVAHAQGGEADGSGVGWDMPNKGIVVTKEVHVTYTEEERIQRVIGF